MGYHGSSFLMVLLLSILTFLRLFPVCLCQISTTDKRSLINVCLDGKNHKTQPGPEDDLHVQVDHNVAIF